jgi:hypothetical protein
MKKLAAIILQREAKRIRDDAEKAGNTGSQDEMIEIAVDYERLANRIIKLEQNEARVLKSSSR